MEEAAEGNLDTEMRASVDFEAPEAACGKSHVCAGFTVKLVSISDGVMPDL